MPPPPTTNGQSRAPELQSVVEGLQEIGQRVSATASAWINPSSSIVKDITPHLKRPSFQKRLLSSTSPSELLRTNLSPSEISYRQITYLSDDLLRDIPEDDGKDSISLFQGFEASLPDPPRRLIKAKTRGHHRSSSSANGRQRHAKTSGSIRWERERDHSLHMLDIVRIRKSLASTEIKEIDSKLSTLSKMRDGLIVKLEQLEVQEIETTDELQDIETKLLDSKELEEINEAESEAATVVSQTSEEDTFLSQSTYGSLSKASAAKARKRKAARRKSTPILHQHYDSGALIKSLPAHAEAITTLDFDYPFGTMITASMDDTVRVWNLATGRCQGLLEGHIASVRCIQLEDTIVATGSTDAKIKLWDLGLSDKYASVPASAVGNLLSKHQFDSDEDLSSQTATTGHERGYFDTEPAVDCCVFTMDAHVGEVTALHFINQTLVSGSQDRTIRQWDMNTGRLLQTMDVLGYSGSVSGVWGKDRRASIIDDGSRHDFVGALQCFEQGLAAGTSDGTVRFWDLRSGQVARELTGHTGPVTSLQFDDVHLVSGSLDRSIRIWDLRTGSIHDAYAYERGITALQFDARKIITAAGDASARIYDRIEGRHWACGEDDINTSVVSCVRHKEGFLLGGRSDGSVSVWSI